jgi:hypothetical protein
MKTKKIELWADMELDELTDSVSNKLLSMLLTHGAKD